MRATKEKKSIAASARTWAATLIRKRGEYSGIVEGANRAAAEAAAVKLFGLTEEQRERLVLQECV
jgi:hypothetical protein